MKIKGIDVSTYNVITDYAKVVAAGVEFAILKVINKSLQPDKCFETHWAGFEGAGVPIQGVYNYSYATTVSKFKTDAQRVLEVLAGRKTMVWLDIENNCQKGLGKTLANGINAYAEVIQAAGLQFGVYTGLSFYNSYLKPYAAQLQYPFWVARYPVDGNMIIATNPSDSKRPDIGRELYGWQYSSKGIVNGINGNVDLNEWYVDIEAQTTVPQESVGSYIVDGFRKELAAALKLKEYGSAAEVLARTVTISAKTNRNHACVTALERLLKEHGYYTGVIEADQGKKPTFGNGMAKATALYQANIVGLKKPDQEWTKGNKSYKKALQM